MCGCGCGWVDNSWPLTFKFLNITLNITRNKIYNTFTVNVIVSHYIPRYRRRIYRSYEAYNCSKDLEERVGVPQRFGIHYAVGTYVVTIH